MPIYEYRCGQCARRASILVRTFAATTAPTCPSCGSPDLRKLISRFAVMKSEESRLEAMADPANFGDVDEQDPRSVARWARRMGKDVGEDLGPEFDEMVDRMEAGELDENDLAGGGDGLGADSGWD